MITVSRQVNFGSRKTGLSTVGYTLLNEDGTTKQARAITGVSELIAGSGAYGALMNFEDTWRGIIIWDTGEATPLYAFDSFNYSDYAAAGGGGGFVVQGEFLSQAEKEQVFNSLRNIVKAVSTLDGRIQGMGKSVATIDSGILKIIAEIQSAKISMRFDDILKMISAVESSIVAATKAVREAIAASEVREAEKIDEAISSSTAEISESVGEGLKGIDLEAIGKSVANLQESVNKVKKEVELSVKIAAKLISTEDLKTILKEGGFDGAKLAG